MRKVNLSKVKITVLLTELDCAFMVKFGKSYLPVLQLDILGGAHHDYFFLKGDFCYW